MSIPAISSPVAQLINGHRYDFSSIEANFGPLSFTNIQAISYTSSLEPGTQRGQSSKKLGRTRGTYEASGSLTVLKEDGPTLIAALAALGQGGYGEAVWDMTVTYSSGLADPLPTVDRLIGIRITEDGEDHSIGNDTLVTVYALDIMEVTKNGLSMTSGGNSLAGVGASLGGIIGGGL